jgi:tRNA nucleotidyltransferase (CCA-adding enzyme)
VLDERVTAIAEAVRAAGGRALVVGGWVRDRLLEVPLPDPAAANVDLEVFGVSADRLRSMLEAFGRVEPWARRFRSTLGSIDVCFPPRIQVRPRPRGSHHRRPLDVHRGCRPAPRFHRQRDFQDPLTGEYLDPAGGRNDLERRVLRMVDPATLPTTACASCARFNLPRD